MSDEDCDDERVHSENTRHDDGNEALVLLLDDEGQNWTRDMSGSNLHDEVGSESAHAGNTNARLGGTVRSTSACISR